MSDYIRTSNYFVVTNANQGLTYYLLISSAFFQYTYFLEKMFNNTGSLLLHAFLYMVNSKSQNGNSVNVTLLEDKTSDPFLQSKKILNFPKIYLSFSKFFLIFSESFCQNFLTFLYDFQMVVGGTSVVPYSLIFLKFCIFCRWNDGMLRHVRMFFHRGPLERRQVETCGQFSGPSVQNQPSVLLTHEVQCGGVSVPRLHQPNFHLSILLRAIS